MSSDQPFDNEAPARRPAAPPAGPPPAVRAPGRRPSVRGTSRARTGGAAQPLPADDRSRTSSDPRAGTGRSGRPAAAPPSFSPGGGSRGGSPRTERPAPDAGPRTRVMPAGAAPGAAPARAPRASSGGNGDRPPDAPPTRPKPSRAPRRRRPGRRIAVGLVVLLVLLLAWPVGLLVWANGRIQHTEALSGGASTPGTTYLLAGSDSRDDGVLEGDTTAGQRTDTIMLLTVPPSGASSLISLPRDTYVDIPGQGANKLNAAYAFGGAPLLVETVEGLTGIGVDHYVEIGMGGVADVVDAVGGVQLCLDYDVDDPRSELVWEAGCHMADGATALAFSRMRYSDPLGDIGRTQRQQQVIQAVTSAVADPSLAVQPGRQVDLVGAGLGALTVSDGTNILDLGRMALAFRNATGADGVRGAPPIADGNYRPGGVGSSVLLADTAPAFFASVADGTVTQEDAEQLG